MDTALTKYSTLRIAHIGRTEEGGKTCGPGFFPSQVLSREDKTLKDNTLGRLFPLISQEALLSLFPPLILLLLFTQIVLNVWDSGNYTAGWDDDEGGTAGWTELGPLLDAHSWGGGCKHSRPKVRMPKNASDFFFFFSPRTHSAPHHIDPSIP